ncbi:NUMOD4 domain-containing protein [Bacillus badius]|uniref:NUMOD4 domain-containing protein n=1 Tax=Bacillus badius TaxID=1455 RepID=UPI0005970456|nr:NUMOD4 domain-containing protein [Bacillus badius]KIL74380.1 hypothetical protein SD78_1449 [Bacillus badius]
MQEESRDITGFEGLYKITKSGRVYSFYQKRYLTRCDDEYGFHIVKLTKNGESGNHKVFELWKRAFGELDKSEFKGALKAKYK